MGFKKPIEYCSIEVLLPEGDWELRTEANSIALRRNIIIQLVKFCEIAIGIIQKKVSVFHFFFISTAINSIVTYCDRPEKHFRIVIILGLFL